MGAALIKERDDYHVGRVESGFYLYTNIPESVSNAAKRFILLIH